jgi:hypothetical protein
MVDHVQNPAIFGDEKVFDLLIAVAEMKVNKNQY